MIGIAARAMNHHEGARHAWVGGVQGVRTVDLGPRRAAGEDDPSLTCGDGFGAGSLGRECRRREDGDGRRKEESSHEREGRDFELLEYSEVSKDIPQYQENEDGAEAPAPEFFRAVAGGESA